MLHTVANLKDSVSGVLSGIDLNNVTDLNGALERAASILVQRADIPEASGIQNITLYSGVFDYLCDQRIFGTAINDIRPQGISRNPNDFVVKTDQETFDRTKNFYYPSGTMSTFQYQNGVPIIRIQAPFPKQQVIIDPMNAIGVSPNEWLATGSADNLTVDSTNFYQAPASLKFNLASQGVDLVTNGSFTGSATGWTLGTNWAYNSNNILHTPGSTVDAYQNIGATDSRINYKITLTIGGTLGNVTVGLGTHAGAIGGTAHAAGAGTVTFTTQGSGIGDIVFRPDTAFNGTITNVSVKATSASLSKTLQSPISMTNYQSSGVAFLAIQIPLGATAEDLTNITLLLGSDSSNYDYVSMSQGFLGSWISGEWLLVAFDFSQSQNNGTPDWTKIQYVQIILEADTDMDNFHVGYLFMSLPTPAQILYQSSAIFLSDGSQNATTTINSDDDTIILTNPAYNLYLFESASAVLQNVGASASDATSIKINQTLHGVRARNGAVIEMGLYDMYRGDNPSQELRTIGSYYDTDLPYNNWG